MQPATTLTYQITAELILHYGPDESTVLDAAQISINSYITTQHRLGRDITLSGIFEALHQPGVQNVELIEPAADIVVTASQAAYCTVPPSLTIGGQNV